ncbi:MAG: HAD family phosphatase [Streptococcus sp.]|nr:HAD family phosphatase [Streptococcus sp.]
MYNYKAIIFDMDGVLFDTESFYYRRREVFLDQKGISIKHLPPSFFIGGNMKQIWRAILREEYENWDILRLQEEYSEYKRQHPLPYKELIFTDVKNVLLELKKKNIKLALASNSTKEDILRALSETQLMGYFDMIISGQEVKESKPSPDVYLKVMEELGVKSTETLIIEDSEKGIQAGVSSKADVWAIRDKWFGMDQSKATQLIDSLADISLKIN